MANKLKKNRPGKKTVTAGAGDPNEALVRAFTTALAPVLTELKSQGKKLTTLQASFEEALEASADEEDIDGEEEEDEDIDAGAGADSDEAMESKKVAAARKKKGESNDDDMDEDDDDDEEDDDIDSKADDEGALDDLGEDDDDETVMEPGKMNKNARTNKGRSVATKGAGKPMSSAADKRTIAELTASNDQQAIELEKLRRQAKRNQIQLKAAGERVDRKSVSVSSILASTLAKGNVDIQAMADAGEKMTIAEFDTIAASAGLDGVTSMSMKNDLVRIGRMEDGEVKRRTIQ